jgi:hypothetical protein
MTSTVPLDRDATSHASASSYASSGMIHTHPAKTRSLHLRPANPAGRLVSGLIRVAGHLPEESPGEALRLGVVHLPGDDARRVMPPPLAAGGQLLAEFDDAGAYVLGRCVRVPVRSSGAGFETLEAVGLVVLDR